LAPGQLRFEGFSRSGFLSVFPKHIIHPRQGRHHARETERGGGEEDGVADLLGSATRLEGAPGVAVHGALQTGADGDAQLDQRARLGLERAGRLSRGAETALEIVGSGWEDFSS
jgi:hypothetical protein